MSVIKLTKNDIIKNNDSNENGKIKLKKNQISYDSALINNWETTYKSSVETINSIYDRINKNEWLSPDDYSKYRKALDDYINTSTRLRSFGKYSEEEEKEWNDSISAMNSTYDEVSKLHSNFDSAEAYANYQIGWLNPNVERTPELIAARQEKYQGIKDRISEIEGQKSFITGTWLPNFVEDIFISKEEEALRDELEGLRTERNEYEREQGVLDNYYQPITDEFLANASYRDYTNMSKDEMWEIKANHDYINSLLRDNTNTFDENGNIINTISGKVVYQADDISRAIRTNALEGSSGGLIDKWTGNKAPNYIEQYYDSFVQDKLGMYLSASEEDIFGGLSWQIGGGDDPGDGRYIWGEIATEGQHNDWRHLTEDEINIYYDLYKREGKASAYKFLDDMTVELNRRATEERAEQIAKAPVLEQILLNAVSIPMNVVGGGLAFTEDALNVMTGNQINPYSPSHDWLNDANAIRQDTALDINNATGNLALPWLGTTFGDVYQSLMSAGDSAFGVALGGNAYGVLMGMGAASSKMKELYERGASVDQMVAGGILSGAAEMIFEKASIDSLVKMGDAKTIKSIIINTLKQGGVEASEEVFTEIANTVADAIVMGSQSNWTDMETFVKDVLNAGLGGFISGGVGASIRASVGKMAYDAQMRDYGQGIINQGGVDTLKDLALEKAGLSKEVDKLASKVGKNASAKNVGMLSDFMGDAISEQNLSDIKNALIAKGLSKKDANRISEYLYKASQGYEFSDKEIADIEGNDKIVEVLRDVVADSNSEFNVRTRDLVLARLGIRQNKASQEATGEAKAEITSENATVQRSAEKEVVKVSESGKTTRISTGEEISIKEIASIKDGDVTLRLENGETISARDVEFSSNDEGLIYENVVDMNLNAATANAFVKGYDPSEGLTVEEYVKGFREAYTYGQYSYPIGEMSRDGFSSKLSEAKKSLAYGLGKTDAKYKVSENQMKVGAKKVTNEVDEGTMSIEEALSTKGLTDRQRESLKGVKVLSDALGTKIRFFESKVDENGKHIGENGRYDLKTGILYIDIYAGLNGEGTILFTAAHELTHFIREWSPAKFKIFADFLLEQYGKKGISVDALVREQIAKAKRNGRSISYDTAYEEVIADSCEAMLSDGDAIAKIAKLKAKDRTLWQKIKDFITDIVAKIKKAYEGLKPDSVEGRFVSDMLDVAEQLKALWTDALVDASETYSKAETDLAENGVLVDSKTESASLMSVRDVLDDKQRDKVAKTLATRFDVTQQEATEWLKAETSLASLILNPKYSQYLDYTADVNEEAIKSNSDYPQGTVDFSNICKKRRDFTEIMNRVLRSFPNHVFDPTDLAKIRTIMEQEGMEVACAICYVEDRRQQDSVVAQDFINSLALYREGSQTRPDGKPFNTNQLKALKLIDESDYTPSIYELISLEGRNELKAKNPAMEEAWVKFNNARGMQSVRLLLNDAEYKRQILKYNKNTVKSKNDNGGLRIYSFSDMEMFHLIDIIQVITDSATVGLSIQGYTKVNEYAKAVKDTGEKLNRSLIPKGDLGYHMEKGKVVLDFDTVEGIDINHPDFFDSTDNPNVGNIVIGINPTQIRAAMMSKFIDYIIPFHTGQSKEVLGEKGIAEWVNYKDSQTEKDLATGKTSKHQINIYTEVIQDAEKTGKPITNKVEFVNKFLEVCKENNLVPRFSEFLNTDENGNYVYTEGYHKFLVDFKTFDSNTGEYLPQMPVKPIFDSNYLTKLLRDYVKTQQVKDAEFAEKSPKVLERITNEIIKPSDTKFSDRDSWNNIKTIQGLESYSVDEVIDIAKSHIQSVLEEYGEYAEIIAVRPLGSRAKGTAKADSDLDIVVQYEGDIREDDMFNMLNDEDSKLYIEGIEVDINPIRADESGDIEDYLGRVYDFDKYSEAKYSDRDSLGNELSKEQQEFFKDSKVRDAKGNLKVVYHGTKAKFNVFAKGDIGFHFGTKGAARGRVGTGKDATIKEVYLNITNPISINKDLGSWNADTLAIELFNMKLLTKAEAESVLFTDDKLYRRSTDSANKKLREMLLQKGYDGIEYRNTFESKKDSTSYIAFNSNQVKEISNAKPTPSADIRYSFREYTEKQKENWKDAKRIVLYDNETQFRKFIHDARYDKNFNKKMYFGAISSELAEVIKSNTGLDVEGFNCSLSAYEIKKIFKDHGNAEKEGLRGQRAITESDIVDIPKVIQSPQNIKLSKKQYQGKPAIEFSKQTNGVLTVVAVVSDKHLDLFVQTAYVGIKKGNLAMPIGEQAPINTPKASNGTVSNNRISQNPDSVNTKFSERDTATFNGKPFWSGSVSLLDGVIEEVHSFNEAEDADFHHTMYFSKAQLEKMENGDNAFFFVENGQIQGNWRESIPKSIINKIKEQIDVTPSDPQAREFSDADIKYSVREEAPPKNTIEGYKVFVVKNGKLYPPMVANPNAEDTPVGVWLNADVGTRAADSKTGRMQVKAGGKGTQGGSGSLAFRPGWHLGETPLATQFDRLNPETGVKELFPENFVWALCDIAADHDYQKEAMSYGYTKNGKFQHSLAGLPKLPTDGYYKYRTNPNPDTVPWLITGAMKVKKLLSDAEVNAILESKGLSPKQRVGGNKTLADLGLSEYEDKLYSDRDTDSVSNRSLLANALESVAQNDIEKNKLKQYKEKIALIEKEQTELSQIRTEIKELSFAKGKRDTVKIKDLQNEATRIANRINTYDRQLLTLESTKALKNVLEREKQMAYKKAEQRGKDALAKYREKATATQRELMNRYQESRAKGVEGRHKTEMRNKIKKVVSDLNKLLLNPTKEQHVPIGLQKVVAEALDAINMDTMNAEQRVAYYNDLISKSSDPDEIAMLTKKRDFFEYHDMNFKDRITALKNAYQEFKESDDPLIRNAHNEAIEDLIKNTADSVGNKSLKDMSLEQLESVHNMYKAILATVRNSNKMFKDNIQATITENSESVKVQVKEAGGHKDRVNKLLKPIKQFGWNMLKPVTAMKVIGSKTFAKLFDNVRAGEDTWAVDVNEAKDFFNEKSKKYNYKKWDFKKHHSFKDSRGNDFSLSLEQIMSLYAYSKRSQADKHLELGGFIFDDAIEVTEKNKLGIPMKYEVNDANPYRINLEIMSEIASTLTEEQRAFVDEMQAYLSDVMGEKGNEVSLAMYDIKLYNEKYYFPLKSSRYFREFDSEKSATPKIKNSGFSKKTVPQAGNPIVLSNFMDVWANHVNDMSMYHAFVLPLEDFMRVYNYSSVAGGYDSVQQYIKNAYGSQANQYIEKLMEDLNGGARVDSTAGVINKGLSLFKKASVFASASVVVQQPSAIARAFAYINPKYFVTSAPSALNLVKHKSVWAEIKKYAPVAVIKEMGYFDTGMGKSTVEWIKGNQTIKDKVDDALSKAPAFADEVSWSYIWEAIKRETKATTNLAFGSEEFLKKCGERFTEIITNTQVYDSVLSRSGMMRSKDTGMKMATAFMAEPTTTVNMMVDGILQGKRGNKKFTASTVGAVSASIILNSILVSLVYAARDDDEDETYLEKYIGSLTTELIDGFNPLTYIPFVKDIWSIAQGFDVERADMSVISDLWATVEGIFNEDKSGWEKVSDVAGAISSMFGIPLKNILRDGEAIYNLVENIASGTPTTGAGIGYAVEDAFKNSIPLWGRFNESDSKSDKLYDAIISGDQNQIDRIKGQFKDEKAIESAMRQGLRENDPRIKEAAQAVVDGNGAERGRIAKEIIAEGNFSMKTVTAAINAEVDELRKRKKEENKKTSK